jgi:KEOPS complex subunit Cgi121
MEAIRVEGEIKDVEKFLKRIERVEKRSNVLILPLDETYVYGKDQIRAAVMHAKRNFIKNKNVARDMKSEIMRYIAGERQIKDAIKKIGIKKGQRDFLTLIFDGDFNPKEIIKRIGVKEKGWMKENREKVDEALERMALIDVMK